MKREDFIPYEPYLQPKMRIGLGLPITGGGLFKDSAVIEDAKDAALLIRLASEEPPAGVCVEIGSPLSLGVMVNGESYCCCAITTEKKDAGLLRVQLFGPFSPGDPTEVLWLNTEIKLKYASPTGLDIKEIESDWTRRRHLEHIKYQALGELALAAERARVLPPCDLDWQELKRGAGPVRLGAYGIGARMPERLLPGQLLLLDLQLPLDVPRKIWTVARVVAVKEPEQVGRRTHHETWMEFEFLHPTDSELILHYISVAQRDQLREHAAQNDPIDDDDLPNMTAPKPASRVLPMVAMLVLIALVIGLFTLLTRSPQNPGGEIQRTYEKAIRQYRHLDNNP